MLGREEQSVSEEEQSKKPLFAFAFAGLLALAEGKIGNAGSEDIHQPRSIAVEACVCAGRASMPAGFRLGSRRRSSGRPSRHRSLMRVSHHRRTLSSSLAEGIGYLNLHVQACASTQNSHMSWDSSRMLFWSKDKSSPAWLVEYACAAPMSLVEMSCNIVVNNIHSQAAVVS